MYHWNTVMQVKFAAIYNAGFVDDYTPLFHDPVDPLDWVVE
jgi:hypothetical protein